MNDNALSNLFLAMSELYQLSVDRHRDRDRDRERFKGIT